MPTLLSYNTSWVLDCHYTQFGPEFAMSEASSILAKAIVVYNNDESTPVNEKIPLTLDEANAHETYREQINFVNKEAVAKDSSTKPIYEINPELLNTELDKLFNHPDIGQNFDALRKNMSMTNTVFLRDSLILKPDFIALIEQAIHVPSTNHANYDNFMRQPSTKAYPPNFKKPLGLVDPGNKLDLGDKNMNYGILNRINMLGLADIDETDNGNPFVCVYDNIINYDAANGEGIAIVYRRELFDTPLLWNTDSHPSHTSVLDQSKFTNKNKEVHYYSADLGPLICLDDNGKTRYATARLSGTKPIIDAGRPIIMTGGYNSTTSTLHVFVATHAPNIGTLLEIKDDKYINYDVFGEFLDMTNVEDVKKRKNITQLLADPAMQAKAQSLFSEVLQFVISFIESGITSAINISSVPLNAETKVNIYLGGDFNDPTGFLLTTLLSNGIDIKLHGLDTVTHVKFNYKLTSNPATTNQGKYENLYSCCANADSLVDGTRRTVSYSGVFDAKHLNTLITDYPGGFYKPENFGYNGDYALFGTSDIADKTVNTLQPINENELINAEYGIHASDHLPVISTPLKTGGRGQRKLRPSSHRTQKRRVKKTYKKRNSKVLSRKAIRATKKGRV